MILVTGSTGTNGIEIVRLLSRVGVPCRALVRNPHKATIFSDLRGVEVVEGDLARPETLAPALASVDRALLCSSIGPDLVKLQRNFVRAAKEAGVPYVVKFSGMDADPHSEWRFLRWHGEAEKELEDSGLAFTINSCRFIYAFRSRSHLKASSTRPAGTRWSVPSTCGTSLQWQSRFSLNPSMKTRNT